MAAISNVIGALSPIGTAILSSSIGERVATDLSYNKSIKENPYVSSMVHCIKWICTTNLLVMAVAMDEYDKANVLVQDATMPIMFTIYFIAEKIFVRMGYLKEQFESSVEVVRKVMTCVAYLLLVQTAPITALTGACYMVGMGLAEYMAGGIEGEDGKVLLVIQTVAQVVDSIFALFLTGAKVALAVLLVKGVCYLYSKREIVLLQSDKSDKKKSCPVTHGVNLGREAELRDVKVTARKIETNQLINILCLRNNNNPILVGVAGVGKTAIVNGLALRMEDNDPTLPRKLRGKKIIRVDMNGFESGTTLRGQVGEKVVKLIEEAEKSGDILFFDEVHNLLSAGNAMAVENSVGNRLKEALTRRTFCLIGSTTSEEYDRFSKDKALRRRLKVVPVETPTEKQLKDMISRNIDGYQVYHRCVYSKDALKCARGHGRSFPLLPCDAFEAIDEAGSAVTNRHERAIQEGSIAEGAECPYVEAEDIEVHLPLDIAKDSKQQTNPPLMSPSQITQFFQNFMPFMMAMMLRNGLMPNAAPGQNGHGV